MKATKQTLLALLFLLPQLGAASTAEKSLEIQDNLNLKCGKSENLDQAIYIVKADPSSYKPLLAHAYVKGAAFIMEGSYEKDDLGEYMAFVDIGKPQFQLLIETPREDQESVVAIFLEITGADSAIETPLNCTIEKQ